MMPYRSRRALRTAIFGFGNRRDRQMGGCVTKMGDDRIQKEKVEEPQLLS